MSQATKQEFSFTEVQSHPELVLDLLADEEIALTVRRQGDKVVVYRHRVYSDDVNTILKEATAIAMYQAKKQSGYSREDAFEDFIEAQEEINEYLQDKS